MNLGDVKLEIINFDEEIGAAIVVIQKLKKINDLKFKVTISIDLDMPDMGCYCQYTPKLKYHIFFNPFRCGNYKVDKSIFPGSVEDSSSYGVLIHEFMHLLEDHYKLESLYGKKFPTERLFLNDYTNTDLGEEVAEVGVLYVTNPYLLKLISVEHWKFFKSCFKSPMPCSNKKCSEMYLNFHPEMKERIKEKWGVVYNVDTETMEHIQEVLSEDLLHAQPRKN